MSAADSTPLVDHHCHGLIPTDLTGDEFRLLATEADNLSDAGLETLDHQFGIAITALCAPALDLPAHTSINQYLERRAELGADEVNQRLLTATNSAELLIDSGFTASPVLSPENMHERYGVLTAEVVRLERIAEEIAPGCTAEGFIPAFAAALEEAAQTAVGFKSVIAYRYGFDLASTAPTATQVTEEVSDWLAESERTGSYRLENPTVLQHLLWAAIGHRKPIQLHTGYGDSDIQLFRADPSRATRFFQATEHSGAKFTLLHCYPFIREAAILSQVFTHVYCDVGVTGHYLGPSATTAVRHVLEIAPFNKIMYSSDAYGLAEHYYVSATNWRKSLGRILDDWIADDWIDLARADRIVAQLATDNATRIYALKTADR